MRRFARIVSGSCLVLGFVLVGPTSSALAQNTERPLQFGVGFQFAHASQGGFSATYPFGFHIRLGRDFKQDDKKAIGIAGLYSLSFHNETDASDKLSSFGVGPRIKWKGAGISPFVQGVVGFSRDHFSSSFGGQNFSGTDSGMSFGAGAGIDKALNAERDMEVAGFWRRVELGSPNDLFEFFVSIGWHALKKTS